LSNDIDSLAVEALMLKNIYQVLLLASLALDSCL